ncbi:MAG: TolC family protein, partial [Rubricoccaceae bacterium]|nr:TolC family protein [Rubricoccaceae bacterium]
RRAVAEAEAGVVEAEAGVLAAELALEAQEAYIALARVQAVDALVRDYRARLDAFAEAAAVRYEVGRGPQAAILRVQLEAGRLDARLSTLDAEGRLARATLARLLDHPALPGQPVAAAPAEAPLADSALVARALRLRPETAVLEAAARQAAAEEALSEIARYPEVGVHATYFDIADADLPATADGRDAVGLGVTVRVPLDQASRRARIEAARLRAAQVETQQEALTTAITTHVEAHLHHAHHERDALLRYRRQLLPQAETTVESTLAAYTTGQADFLALLDAERTRFELRVAEAETEARYLTALARLARALGVPSLYDLAPQP